MSILRLSRELAPLAAFCRKRVRCGLLLFLSLAVVPVARAAVRARFPAPSQWNGYDRYDFSCDARPCIVAPQDGGSGQAWIWRARFFGHEPGRSGLVGPRVPPGIHGCRGTVRIPQPSRVECLLSKTTTQQAGPGVALGMSRGGLYIYNWASESRKVACIYADARCATFAVGPDARAPAARRFFAATAEELRIDRGAARRVPRQSVTTWSPWPRRIHCCTWWATPTTSSVAENTAILEARYKQLGGQMRSSTNRAWATIRIR